MDACMHADKQAFKQLLSRNFAHEVVFSVCRGTYRSCPVFLLPGFNLRRGGGPGGASPQTLQLPAPPPQSLQINDEVKELKRKGILQEVSTISRFFPVHVVNNYQ